MEKKKKTNKTFAQFWEVLGQAYCAAGKSHQSRTMDPTGMDFWMDDIHRRKKLWNSGLGKKMGIAISH